MKDIEKEVDEIARKTFNPSDKKPMKPSTTKDDESYALALELSALFPKKNESEIIREVLGEIMPPLETPVVFKKPKDIKYKSGETLEGKNIMGLYDHKNNEIVIDPDLKESEVAPTVFHEGWHANEMQRGYKPGYSSSTHFKDLPGNRDQALADMLQQKRVIEAGGNPDKTIMANMPWLEKVRSLSTNEKRIPTPWKKGDWK